MFTYPLTCRLLDKRQHFFARKHLRFETKQLDVFLLSSSTPFFKIYDRKNTKSDDLNKCIE